MIRGFEAGISWRRKFMVKGIDEHLLEESAAVWGKGAGKRAGRPTLDDDRLAADRDALEWLLSVGWPDVGWQLPKAKTLQEVRQALEPLRGHPSESLIVRFLRPTSVTATAKEIRQSRNVLGKAVEYLRQAQERHDRCTEACREGELAMSQARHEQREIIETEFTRRRADLESAKTVLDKARDAKKTLENDLANKEASFAQHQLLAFIKKKNYARNPLRLANAMAGLPDLGWSVSYARCSKMTCSQSPSFPFRVFETIKAIWNRRDSDPELSPVQLFRQEIKKLPKTVEATVPQPPPHPAKKERIGNFLRSHLAENWLYLRLAIEESLKSKIHPTRVPFLIASQFDKNLAKPRSAADCVLAANERID